MDYLIWPQGDGDTSHPDIHTQDLHQQNTELCKKNAMNDLEKDLFKMLNNSVFGKSMQNNRKLSGMLQYVIDEGAQQLEKWRILKVEKYTPQFLDCLHQGIQIEYPTTHRLWIGLRSRMYHSPLHSRMSTK